MKKTVLLSLTLLALLTISCKKEEKEKEKEKEVKVESKTGVLNCKLDGVLWESTSASATIDFTDKQLRLKGEKSGEKISFFIEDGGSNFETTYGFGTIINTGSYEDSKNDYTTYSVYGEGNLKVSDLDTVNKTMTGTFNFVATPIASTSKKKITEGLFTKIPYTE